MKDTTLVALKSILQADSEVDPAVIDKVVSICRVGAKPRSLITAKRAMEILGVSAVTFYTYIEQGKVQQIRQSPRKIRYDLDKIECLKNYGVPQLA